MKPLLLSPYSLLFWHDYQLNPTSSEFNLSFTQSLHGNFNIERFRDAVTRFLRDHPLFNSHITVIDNVPHWQVTAAKIEVTDYDDSQQLTALISHPFILTEGPLYRVLLQTINADQHILTLVFHHILLDGNQFKNIISQLSQYYNDQYHHCISNWQAIADKNLQLSEHAEALTVDESRNFWQLTGNIVSENYVLPFQNEQIDKTPALNTINEVRFSLNKQHWPNIAGYGYRPFTLFSQIWGTMLARCAGQNDLALFYPVAVRLGQDLQFGAQINTSLIPISLQTGSTLNQLCQQAEQVIRRQDALSGSYLNELPTHKILQYSGCRNVQLAFAQTDLRNTPFAFDECNATPLHHAYCDLGGADLALEYEETANAYAFRLRFRTTRFVDEQVSRCTDYFSQLLANALAAPDVPLLNLPLITTEESAQLLPPPAAPSLQQHNSITCCFEQIALKYPERPAISYLNTTLSYRQLDELANKLAKNLHTTLSSGTTLQNGQPIAIYCDKGPALIIAILASLKAGHAYMPIAIDAANERTLYQLEHTACPLMLVTSAHLAQAEALIACLPSPPLLLNFDITGLQSQQVAEPCNITPALVAAIIFTSGTTGNPKGVLVEQAAIVETVTSSNYLQLTEQDVCLFLANPIFDAATLEIWGALLNGGKLVIPQSTQALASDITAFRQLIRDEGVSYACVTRTLFDTLYLLDKHLFDSLKYLLVGGEALTLSIMTELSTRAERPQHVINAYGPTECTTMSSWYDIPADFSLASLPIGQAISGRELYVLNEQLQLQPPGAIGELYIGGRGLAAGYINSPQQTASSFINNPFRPGRLYKTGDQVKSLPDGNLLFCGRNDTQVKIRGHRIELSEIESAINRCTAVQQSAVLALPKAEGGQLAAWFVVKTGQSLSAQQLKEELTDKLPGYMIPRYFTVIDAIPLTLSGKLDYRALKKPTREVTTHDDQPLSPTATVLLKFTRTLLNDSSISLQDHFYRLGGDSIQAIQLIAQLRQAGVNAALSDLDKYASLGELAEHLRILESVITSPAQVQVDAYDYPVTPLQAGLLTWTLTHPDDDAYFIQQVMEYRCPLQLVHYYTAWDLVRQRYPSLRTEFDWQQGTFRQRIIPWQALGAQGMQLVDISRFNAEEQQQQFAWFMQQQRSQPINLNLPGTLHLTLFKFSDNHFQLIKSEHHAISDGWSCSNIWLQLHRYYDQLIAGESPHVVPETAWLQTLQWQQDHRAQCQQFWQQQALGFAAPNNIAWLLDQQYQPADLLQVKEAQERTLTLKKPQYQSIKLACQQTGTTFNTLLQFAWHKLMQIYTNDSQTLVGTVLSGRNLPIDGITESAGLFINTLPLAVNWPLGVRIDLQLQNIHHAIVAMNQHHAYPLSDLQSGQQRLFQSLVVFENYPEQHSVEGLGAHAQSLAIVEKLDYPLVLVAFLRNEQLTLSLKYDAALLSAERAAQLVDYVAQLMYDASRQLDQPHEALLLGNIAPVSESPVQTHNSTLMARFDLMVSRHAQQPALIWQQQPISYQQLDQLANALAHQLTAQLALEEPVIILMDKQPQWLIAMLAVLKAGGCYLPIAVDTPAERVRLIASDAHARYVITSTQHRMQVDEIFRDIADISINCLNSELNSTATEKLPPRVATAAAVLYTSGTSGKPKGVVIEQAALLALVVDANYINISSDDVFIFLANPAFDAASLEIWGALLNGARLIIPENTLALISDATRLQAVLQQQSVSIMWLTRSLFDALYLADNQLFNQLRYLLVGGEALTPGIMKQLAAQTSRPTHIINGYGPTECTTFTTTYAIPPQETHATIPLGRAISGRSLWILDNNGNPLPPGAPGELYVGGIGLARSYLNQPEQTEQRFIMHASIAGRLYRTGDRVRQLADGHLEYLGRIDNQVKIRGYRIEPEEVAMSLLSLPGIQQAAVTVWQQGTQKQLAAWLVAPQIAALDIAELRRALEDRLPEYMVPASFNLLERLPLTANGKLDEKALPTPASAPDREYAAPRNELEKCLCAAWRRVLNLDEIGIHDNFFRMGGDSIQSILLVTELRKIGYRLDAGEINRLPTVAKMAQLLTQQAQYVAANEQQVSGESPLLPIQRWFFAQQFAAAQHWNQAFMLRLPQGLRTEQLGDALRQLVSQHDMLRTHYRVSAVGITQWIASDDDFTAPTLEEIDASVLSLEQLESCLTAWQSDFDYQHGPLWRAAIIRQHPQGGDRLWLAFHHLIIDAVSWRILGQDMQQLIEHGKLGPKSTSYRRWAQAQESYLQEHEDDVLWWQQAVAPAAHSTLMAVAATQRTKVTLSAEQTQQLLREAGRAWNTNINDLLLAALALALQQVSQQAQHQIMLEGHGREPWDEQIDLAQTVGWFTTMFPVNLSAERDAAATIVATKELLRQIPAKGIGYGIARQHGLLPETTAPAVAFNYLGVLSSSQHAWSLATEHCGTSVHADNASSFVLTLNGAVNAGQLTFFIDSQLAAEQTAQFTSVFQQALSHIIALCCQQAQQPQRTASDYGPLAVSAERLQRLQRQHPNLDAILPATPLQQGMIFHTLAHPQDDAYRVQQLMRYDCALNVDHYQQAWQLAAQRFPIMRTAFDWEDGAMLQLVIANAAIAAENLCLLDLSALPANEQQQQLHQLQLADRQQPFALQQPGALRLLIIKHHDNAFSVLKSQHHAICDGWSEPCVLNSVHEYYQALQRGEHPQVEAQTSWIDAQHYLQRNQQKYARFWQQEKAQLQAANDLRCLAPTPVDAALPDDFGSASRTITLNQSTTHLMRACSAQLGVTLNALVQFAWHKLIQVYSQDEQTQVGTVVAGRDLPVAGIAESVGPFINTLPLAITWLEDQSCADILLRIHHKIAELNSHSNIGLVELQSEGQALFNSLVVFENYPQAAHSTGIAGAWRMEAAFEKLDYPLALLAWEAQESLTLQLNFFTQWLSDKDADLRLQQLAEIMQQCVQNPDRLHESILLSSPVLPQPEEIVSGPAQDLLARFQYIVQRYPQHIALASHKDRLSYHELDQRTHQLASLIQQRYYQLHEEMLPPDTPIGLLMDKGSDLVIAMLAILKAGGCYVPVSTDYPQERITFILDETATPLLITQSQHQHLVSNAELPCLLLEECDHILSHTALPEPATTTGAIIFTSGTTGVPKGVPIARQAMVDLVVNNHYINIDADDALLFLSSPVFDAATFEIWGALLNGAKLVIPPSTQELASDTQQFKALLEQESISVMWVTRSLFDVLYLRQRDLFNSLRYLLVGGEALSADIMRQLAAQPERPQHILNGYGPTECTTFTTVYEITTNESGSSIPIGRAIAGRQLYVLNKLLKPLPQGAPGELYVGGSGVASGYLNRPDLSAKHFITNPFGSGTLYKTGDWVRYRADGQLEYLGRKDQQVKIRGFRVELEEIATALKKLPGVQHAVVQLRDVEGQKMICAWCMMLPSHTFSGNELLGELERSLPDYMLPGAIMALDRVPVTVNGKLDSTQLPVPQRAISDNFCAPRTPLESSIAAVWQQVLGCTPVSVNANFFRIGGDSIQSILVTTELRKRGIHCSTRDIFAAKTIEQLARLIELRPQPQAIICEQGLLSGTFALLPVQHWFNDLHLANPHWFNQAFTLTLPANVTPDEVRQHLLQLVNHHDMLRARFTFNGKKITEQHYVAAKEDTLPFAIFDRASLTYPQQLEEKCSVWQKHFNLQQGALYRFVYLYDNRGTQSPALFCAFHHLIIDAVSWRIVASDLQTLFAGNALPPKATSYRQWQQCIRDYAAQHHQQENYWQTQIIDQPNYWQHAARNATRVQLMQRCSTQLTDQLLHQVHHVYHTEVTDFLLTALSRALQSWHGASTSYLTLEGHGREDIAEQADVSRTLGWFTTLFPLRLTHDANDVLSLRLIKDQLRAIPDKGIGYGALKFAAADSVLRNHQLPAISFNYLGQISGAEPQPWMILAEGSGQQSAGENTAHNVLDFTASVVGNALIVNVDSALSKTITAQIMTQFSATLEILVTHCLAQQQAGNSWFSPADFPDCNLTLAQLDQLQNRFAIEAIYPATGTQRELLYFNRLNPDYQIDQNILRIDGPFNAQLMTQAWQYAAQRYDVLRTGYIESDNAGQPLALVSKQIDFPVTLEMWSAADTEQLNRRMLAERNRLMPVDQPCLMKVVLICVSPVEHYMIQTFNHVLFDGWSLNNILSNLVSDYQTLERGDKIALTPRSFAAFPHWLQRCDHSAADHFWSRYLHQAPMNQRLTIEKLPPIDLSREKRMRKFAHSLDHSQTAALQRFATRTGFTPNQVTQLAWMQAMSQLLDSDDVVIGTTMSERPAEIDHVADLAGLFVASPVLRLQQLRQKSVNRLLAEIASSQVDRQQFAFHELNHYDSEWRPTSPFGSLFVFESMPKAQIGELPFVITPLDNVSGSNHQTVLCLIPEDEQLFLSLFYDASELSEATVSQLCSTFIQCIDAIVR